MKEWKTIFETHRTKIFFAALTPFLGFLFFREKPAPKFEEAYDSSDSFYEEATLQEKEMIMVDIKGEVKRPGVYELEDGARMQELILLAGGFTEDAKQQVINLAAMLRDQQLVYIPHEQEETDEQLSSIIDEGATDREKEKININTATQTELMLLDGIGSKKAEAIIAYREENGSFKAVDDLAQVSGIGEKTVENLRDSIKI